MSHDCSIRADLSISEPHADAAVACVEDFVRAKNLADSNVQELFFDGHNLGIYIDFYGEGGMRDDGVQSLADRLSAFVAEPGVIEFLDHDAPSTSDDALGCYWVAAGEEAKRQARIRYGIRQMREWVHVDDFEEGSLAQIESAVLSQAKGAPKPQAMEFNFLPQSFDVETLLIAAKAALPTLVGQAREKLESAMRAFEDATVQTSWCVEDVAQEEADPSICMSNAERRKALWIFSKYYATSESDWACLSQCAERVIKDRTPGRHIKVTLSDSTVRFVPVEAVEKALQEDTSDFDKAINIALGIDADVNHLDVDLEHHYSADGVAID